MNRNCIRSAGFTLIELLVVIAIIGLLMAMLFPGVGGAIKSAKRNQARTDATQIANAVNLFWNDYGRLPAPDAEQRLTASQENDQTYFTEEASKEVIRVLIGEREEINPREKIYLDMDTSEEDGTFLDPWGSQYFILLDRDHNNKIQYPPPPPERRTFGVRAVVVSAGPDEDIFTLEDNVANVEFETE
jgi:prepilin-type N-terminal cleavage/methylation domain-containing protein